MPGSGRAEGESGSALSAVDKSALPVSQSLSGPPQLSTHALEPSETTRPDHATIAGGRGQDQLRPSMWMMWTSIGHASVGLAPVLIVLWPVRAVASDGFDHPFSYRSLRFPFEVGFEHHDGTTRS